LLLQGGAKRYLQIGDHTASDHRGSFDHNFRIIGALVAWLIAAHLPKEIESQGEKLTKVVR
jgi:hypothetical protein